MTSPAETRFRMLYAMLDGPTIDGCDRSNLIFMAATVAIYPDADRVLLDALYDLLREDRDLAVMMFEVAP